MYSENTDVQTATVWLTIGNKYFVSVIVFYQKLLARSYATCTVTIMMTIPSLPKF